MSLFAIKKPRLVVFCHKGAGYKIKLSGGDYARNSKHILDIGIFRNRPVADLSKSLGAIGDGSKYLIPGQSKFTRSPLTKRAILINAAQPVEPLKTESKNRPKAVN